MFTGIVEGIGTVRSIRFLGSEATVTIAAPALFSDCRAGDSLSVDGVCLTITGVKGNVFTLDVSGESLMRSTLGRIEQGAVVNLERALRLSDRLGGHLVSGHVDGMGKLEKTEKVQRSWIIQIGIDQSLSRYLIEKGSIAVDGISLTINRCQDTFFEVNIIPETVRVTTILGKKEGDLVNIETDLIAKYVEKFIKKERISERKAASGSIDTEMLQRFGFGDQIK